MCFMEIKLDTDSSMKNKEKGNKATVYFVDPALTWFPRSSLVVQKWIQIVNICPKVDSNRFTYG